MPKKQSGTKPKSEERSGASPSGVECGLCGKSGELTRTECCGQWICDDEDEYVLFSYARNSCYRNHRRYTLCGHHHAEGHQGRWQECVECREGFETEIYAYYGTNEYNFEKLSDPPNVEPTLCSNCRHGIELSEGGYSILGSDYLCASCTWPNIERLSGESPSRRGEVKKSNIRSQSTRRPHRRRRHGPH